MTNRLIRLLTHGTSSSANLKEQDTVSVNPSLKDNNEGYYSMPQSRRSSFKHDLPVRSRASSVSSAVESTRSGHKKSNDHDSGDTKASPDPPRFSLLPDGSHVHYILPKRKRKFWQNMFKGKKDRDDLLPLEVQEQQQTSLDSHSDEKTQDMTKWFGEMQQRLATEKRSRKLSTSSTTSKLHFKSNNELVERYGKPYEVAGSGAYGIVHIHHKILNPETKEKAIYAIKTFRPISQKTQEKEKEYLSRFKKRITAEVSISYALRHPNIVSTFDFVSSANASSFCAVMEYCGGGDLFSLINTTENGLGTAEADCFFKQLMWAVEYMHEEGVAHRDLKPENLLLTTKGVLKIIDFGNSECFFRSNDSSDIILSKGCCGSPPYIAPEEHDKDNAFDPRAVDVWACGLIYMAMRLKRNLWMSAVPTDSLYNSFCNKMKKQARYGPIELLENVS